MLAVLLRPFSTMSPSSLDCWDTTVVTPSAELLEQNKGKTHTCVKALSKGLRHSLTDWRRPQAHWHDAHQA